MTTGQLESRRPAEDPPVVPERARRGAALAAWIRTAPAWIVAGYLVLVLFGATSSSMGIDSMRSDPANPEGLMLGRAQPIRSDEWLTNTPILIGAIQAGGEPIYTPLAQSPGLIYQTPTDGVVGRVVFFDGSALALGRILPNASVFAAYWWMPTLLLLLAMPPWLRRLGASPTHAWMATALTVLAPASAWWSMMPVRILGFAIAASYLTMLAVDRLGSGRRLSGLALAAAGGLLLARLPTYYVPWSITIGVPVVVATWAHLIQPKQSRRAAVLASATAAATGGVLFLAVAFENRAALSAELATLYPGVRRTIATAVSPDQLFGAPAYGFFQGSSLSNLNLSEMSSGFLFFAVWAGILWVAGPAFTRGATRAAITVLAGATLAWTAWSATSLGNVSAHVPVFNRVPSMRSAQTVGYLAVILLVLVLPRIDSRVPRRVAAACAVACAGATAYGASAFRTRIPVAGVVVVVVAAVGVGIIVYCVTRYRDRHWPALLAVAAAAVSVIAVNPLIVGLGDLGNGPVAERLKAEGSLARDRDYYWASDQLQTNALLVATAVPSLSGNQVTGPVRDQWEKLDPTGQYEGAWNRGASYVEMVWTSDAMPVIAVGAAQDQIVISVDPCVLPGLGLNLRFVISQGPLASTCLVPQEGFVWGGGPRYVYEIVS